jgi:hypothetical protein
MPTSTREFSFTLIRVIIFVALVGAAARLVAIAYAPQWFATSEVGQQQLLTCPPDVVTDREAVVSPQVPSVTDEPARSVATGPGLSPKSDLRSIEKGQERRSGAQKPPTYVFARNAVSQKRAATREPVKRGGTTVNQQQKSRASAPTLTHSEISISPFGDMKGQ